MASEDFPAPSEEFVLTHCSVAVDVARSRGCAGRWGPGSVGGGSWVR